MKRYYEDILSRIAEPPTWFDRNGTPRYGEFRPSLVPNIYASEVVLFLIQCQACHREFRVAIEKARTDIPKEDTLAGRIPHLYYGDPPNTDCCSVGPTMSSDSIQVLEYWVKENLKWVRKSEYEVDLADAKKPREVFDDTYW